MPSVPNSDSQKPKTDMSIKTQKGLRSKDPKRSRSKHKGRDYSSSKAPTPAQNFFSTHINSKKCEYEFNIPNNSIKKKIIKTSAAPNNIANDLKKLDQLIIDTTTFFGAKKIKKNLWLKKETSEFKHTINNNDNILELIQTYYPDEYPRVKAMFDKLENYYIANELFIPSAKPTLRLKTIIACNELFSKIETDFKKYNEKAKKKVKDHLAHQRLVKLKQNINTLKTGLALEGEIHNNLSSLDGMITNTTEFLKGNDEVPKGTEKYKKNYQWFKTEVSTKFKYVSNNKDNFLELIRAFYSEEYPKMKALLGELDLHYKTVDSGIPLIPLALRLKVIKESKRLFEKIQSEYEVIAKEVFKNSDPSTQERLYELAHHINILKIILEREEEEVKNKGKETFVGLCTRLLGIPLKAFFEISNKTIGNIGKNTFFAFNNFNALWNIKRVNSLRNEWNFQLQPHIFVDISHQDAKEMLEHSKKQFLTSLSEVEKLSKEPTELKEENDLLKSFEKRIELFKSIADYFKKENKRNLKEVGFLGDLEKELQKLVKEKEDHFKQEGNREAQENLIKKISIFLDKGDKFLNENKKRFEEEKNKLIKEAENLFDKEKGFLKDSQARLETLFKEANKFWDSINKCSTIQEIKDECDKIGIPCHFPTSIFDVKQLKDNPRFERSILRSFFYFSGKKIPTMDKDTVLENLNFRAYVREMNLSRLIEEEIESNIEECKNLSFEAIIAHFKKIHINIDPSLTKEEWLKKIENQGYKKDLATQYLDYQETITILAKQAVNQGLLSKSEVEKKFLLFSFCKELFGLITSCIKLLLCASFSGLTILRSVFDLLFEDLHKIATPAFGLFYLFGPLYPKLSFRLEALMLALIYHFFSFSYKSNEYSKENYVNSLELNYIEIKEHFQKIFHFFKNDTAPKVNKKKEKIKKRMKELKTLDAQSMLGIKSFKKFEGLNNDQEWLKLKKPDLYGKIYKPVNNPIDKGTETTPLVNKKVEKVVKQDHSIDSSTNNPFKTMADALNEIDVRYLSPDIKNFFEAHTGINLVNKKDLQGKDSKEEVLQKKLQSLFCEPALEFFETFAFNRYSYLRAK